MSTKNKVLQMLEGNRENDSSGEQIAISLNISRSAIWKAINELRQDGYVINAGTNKGYRLSEKSDILSAEGIRVFLNKETNTTNIFVYKSLLSTNKTAKQLALDGAKSGSIVVANEQTDGRGRMGRSFFSPPDSGIYMSIILRPKLTAQKGILITTATSVAVCRAIENIFRVSAKIKWVNDVILNGKKICGILTEAVTNFESDTIEYVVLGIGINFSTVTFPDELKDIAGSLQSPIQPVSIRNRLIAEIINQFFAMISDIEAASFIDEYKSRSIALGKEIEVIHHGKTVLCRAVDIDQSGGLVVKYENNKIETLKSGEISIRGDFYHD